MSGNITSSGSSCSAARSSRRGSGSLACWAAPIRVVSPTRTSCPASAGSRRLNATLLTTSALRQHRIRIRRVTEDCGRTWEAQMCLLQSASARHAVCLWGWCLSLSKSASGAAMTILTWIIVGLVAGVLASLVMGGTGYGLIGDIIVGIVGAFVGGWIFASLGVSSPWGGLPGTIFIAFIGAVVLLFLLRLIRGARRTV